MAISFRILREYDLVYVRYDGVTRISESQGAFRAYMQDPASHPGQKQLVDLSGVVTVEQNYTEMIKFMAQMTDFFRPGGPQTLLACFAPTEIAMHLALQAQRSWDGFDHLVYRVFEEEGAALAYLGLPVTSISLLLGQTA